jgi:hypothetical protein
MFISEVLISHSLSRGKPVPINSYIELRFISIERVSDFVSGWEREQYQKYQCWKRFIVKLGNDLHTYGKLPLIRVIVLIHTG